MAALLAFLLSHQALLAAAGVSLLDLVFALKPEWSSNGVLHFILLQLMKMKPSA